MKRLQDIPLELRREIYGQLCRSTTILIHRANPTKEGRCCQEGRGVSVPPAHGVLALLCSSKSIKEELEPIFWQETNFVVHEGRHGCLSRFTSLVRPSVDEPKAVFFRSVEQLPLERFFDREHIQVFLNDSKEISPSSYSLFNVHLERFTVTEPLGCSRYAPERTSELQNLCRLISFCHGRVDLFEFWWHPARWQPSEVAIPWHISVDIDTNFTIEGPTVEGFMAFKRRFQDMLRRGLGRGRRSSRSLGEDADFTFIQRSDDPLPQHTAECMVKSQRRYYVPCNCGPPACFGGDIRDSTGPGLWE